MALTSNYYGSQRRIREVYLSERLIADLITANGGWSQHIYCTQGIPEGAVLVGARHEPASAAVVLSYEHESFNYGLNGTPSVMFAEYHCGSDIPGRT